MAMRNRSPVAAVFSAAVLVWSPIGRDVLRLKVPVPFGLRVDVWELLLSLPVIFCSVWIFSDGAHRALRARIPDMMVLVAVGSAWPYSLSAPPVGDVFYEAATVLARSCRWAQVRDAGLAGPMMRSAPCWTWRRPRRW